ncbi:tyrosine-type recombinase/integrase [Bifidobacterium catenulatum subsp. catenulatum]|uniref:tyrosine-type recombinase/integrase n=1 Tax=Bifidobacterium catenulatum TaxID=1686 RepID=UPI003D347FA5
MKVTIDDLWLKNDDDGNPPSRAAKRSLANSRDPMKANVPEKWRKSRYGVGMRWRCHWTIVKDGRRVQRVKQFVRLAEAQEYAAAMEDDIRRGRYRDPRQELRVLDDVAGEWLASKVDLKPGTAGRYARELRLYILPKWGGMTLRELRPDMLQEWVGQLMGGGYPAALPDGRDSKPLSARSIRNIMKVVLKGIFDYAVSNGWIGENPVDRVTVPKIVSDDDMVFLSVREVELLADEAEKIGKPVDGLLVRWQAYTGCRIGESLALKVGDVDADRRRARIGRTWTDDGHGGSMLGTPKNGKARNIAIPRFLMPQIKAQMDGMGDDDWLFRATRGGNVWTNTWRTRIWNKAVKAAGMEDAGVTIHSLRHTYASFAIAQGADVKTLQMQLGHSSPSITLNTYTALWPERLDDVADAIGALRERELV